VKKYESLAGDVVALKGIDLRVREGEFLVVSGKSGAGKTTLVNMITGLDKSTEGEIWVAGTPVHRLSTEKAARWRGQAVGVVFQTFELLPSLTVLQIDNTPYGYISYETLDKLGEARGLNELYVVSRNSGDKEYVRKVISLVKDKVERDGMTIPMSTTAEPGQFPLSDILDATLALMGLLGIMSLFLSTFLIVNTVSALLAQQRRQIGVMKAVGARTVQVAGMYLGMVVTYGLAALVIALPLTVIGARALSQFMASMLNFDLVSMDTPPQAVILQVAIGLLVPVIASLYPLIANLRITAAEAMSAYQVGKARFGAGLLDRLLSGANLWFARRVLVRPLLLSLRNIFRSKGRLALTLATLTLAGTTFVSILSVSSTLNQTLDGYMRQYKFDSLITLERSYRSSKIDQEARRVPGVVETGEFYTLLARRVRPDGSESDSIYMIAFTAGSGLFNPKIEQGRTLLPGDENALVVSQLLFRDEPDLHLNSDVVLKLNGRERKFRIVGVCLGIMYPMIHANYPYLSSITGSVGRTDSVMVRTEMHDLELRGLRAGDGNPGAGGRPGAGRTSPDAARLYRLAAESVRGPGQGAPGGDRSGPVCRGHLSIICRSSFDRQGELW
jgi:putative ABC transport system permease protein